LNGLVPALNGKGTKSQPFGLADIAASVPNVAELNA
jgi:hypothetical protein